MVGVLMTGVSTMTPAAQLDTALQGRARDVQAKLIDKLSRGEVRELARAIDETVLHELGVYESRVWSIGAQLRLKVAERRGGPRHG